MTKAIQNFRTLAIAFTLATSGSVSAEAQRKAPAVEPSVAETVQQKQAPRIRLPQQQTTSTTPKLDVPVQADVPGPRVRLPGSRLSDSQRKLLAEGLAQRAVTGVGRPTILPYENRQVSLPRKIETTISGWVDLTQGTGLRLRSFPYGSGFRQAAVGVEVFEPAERRSEYFLVDLVYRSGSSLFDEEDLRPQLSVTYLLNGTRKRDELLPSQAQPDGVYTFLIDADSALPAPDNNTLSLHLRGSSIIIKAIEVRPVR